MNHYTHSNPPDNKIKDWVHLFLLLVFGCLPRFWMLSHTFVPSRDTIVFARYALNLGTPPIDHTNPSRRMADITEVIRRAEHPPGFPTTALLCYRLIYQNETPSPEKIFFATQIASVSASLILIIPLYFLAKQLLNSRPAFLIVAIFSVLPVWVEVSSNGLSDPLAILLGIIAVQSAIHALWGKWFSLVLFSLLSGWFIGLGFLVRPDVAILGLSLGLVLTGRLIWLIRSRSLNREWKRMLVCLVLLTSATFSVVLPYRSLIGRWTNKRTGDALIDTLKGKEVEKDLDKRQIPDVGLAPRNFTLFAAWRTDFDANTTQALIWSVRATATEYLKTSFYIYPLFAAIGLIKILRSRKSLEPTTNGNEKNAILIWILGLWGCLHFAILLLVAFKAGYISERHTLPIVLITMIFAGFGLGSYSDWLSRKFPKRTSQQWYLIVGTLLFLVAFPMGFKSLHKQRIGHKEAGLWLKENGNPQYWMIDPYGWVGFYSGRTLEIPPLNNPRVGSKQYVVWEPNGKEPESKTPLYPWAQSLVQQGKIVYAYPPDAPLDKIQVAIYECLPLSEK